MQTASYNVTSDEELRLAIKRKLEKPRMIKFIGKLLCAGLGKNPSTTYQFSVDIYWIRSEREKLCMTGDNTIHMT